MAVDYTTILAALGQTLRVVREGAGPLQPGQLVRLHLEPKTLDLKVPVLLDGQLNVSFLTKSIRFADAAYPSQALVDYLQAPNTILGGMPVPEIEIPMQGPTLPGDIPMGVQVNVTGAGGTFLPPRVTTVAPDLKLPAMEVPIASKDNALSGVPGLLGEIAGTIPIPALVPVKLDIKWKVTNVNGRRVSAASYSQIGTGIDALFLFYGTPKELTTAPPQPTTFLIHATVTLSLPGTPPVHVALPVIPLIVLPILIPTIALLANKTKFGTASIATDDDNARMVMVPSSSPIQDLSSLTTVLNNFVELLNQLTTVPGPPSWSPGLLGTLGKLIDLVNGYVVVNDRFPLVVVRADAVGDTSDIRYAPGDGDNFDDEDEAVMLVGIPKTKLTLATGDNFGGTVMNISTGSEMFVIIEDLGLPTTFEPKPLTTNKPSGYKAASVTNKPHVKNNLEAIGFNQLT